MIGDDEIRVRVERLEPLEVSALGYGVDAEGRRVVFSGDLGSLRPIEAAIEAGETPEAIVPLWSIVEAEWR